MKTIPVQVVLKKKSLYEPLLLKSNFYYLNMKIQQQQQWHLPHFHLVPQNANANHLLIDVQSMQVCWYLAFNFKRHQLI